MVAYLYLAKQIGIAIAFGVWAYIVAKGLFAKSSLRLSPIEEVALLVPVGLAVAIGLLFGLGLAGVLTAPGVLAVAGLALAITSWRLRERHASGLSGTLHAIARRVTPARLVMLLLVGIVLVPVALNGLTPPYVSDEVRYHLPYAMHFVEQGRIVPDLYLRYPFHTLNVNLLYAAALIFGDDVTPHYIHLLLGCLGGLALYVLAVPTCGRVMAFCAVLLFFVTPTFRFLAPTAIIDFGLAAFVTSTIACLDRARGRTALVVCAGLAFGAALGTKYLALALLPLVVAWAAYRTRDGRQVLWFAAVAVLTGAPWYIYNLIWTGNPISPFAGEWFSSWPWTDEDLAAQLQELGHLARGHSLSDLASLPYRLVFEPYRFRIHQPVPIPIAFGLMTLVLLPWWNRNMRPYGLLVLVVITTWFFTVSIFRYLAAILPVWSLISIWSVEWSLWHTVSLVSRNRIIPAVARRHVSYAAATIVLVFIGYQFQLDNRWLDAAAVTERVVHRDRFLRKRISVYGVAEHLRQAGTQDEVIFAFPPGALYSYARRNRVVGDHFGPMSRRAILPPARLCPERLQELLKDISLLVLPREFSQNRPGLNRFLADWGAIEYADQHAAVFRIGSGSEPPNGSPQPDFTDSRQAHISVEAADGQIVPYFPAASDGFLQGVVRIVNHSDEAGTVVIHGIDDAGARYGPTTVALDAKQIQVFNSDDWVTCNFSKRVSGGLTDNEAASWWLSLTTELDIEALSYLRTEDRFETTHEVARTTQVPDGPTIHHVPYFNSGNERSQASHLRLINPGTRDVAITIAGRDDAGEPASDEVHLSLPGGTACWLSATALEFGVPDSDGPGCAIISGRLGNAHGRWRLSVAASGGDIHVMSLLVNPTGQPTNLSASSGVKSGTHTIPLFLPVSDTKAEPHGFARIINHSDAAGTVEIHGIDDTGTSHGPVTLTLDGLEATHLGSYDMEAGNAEKGLPEGLGDGDGYWRLRFATGLDIEVLTYVRTRDGFVTPMHGVSKTTPGTADEIVHYVPHFNPGRNTRWVSWLRLSNSGNRDVELTIEGHDSVGFEAPEGTVRLTLSAGQACMVSAQGLESGEPESGSNMCTGERFDFDGRFGEGRGKWSLYVIADGGEIQVMSLLKSATGYLANLSTSNRTPTGRPAPRTQLDALSDVAIVKVERWGPRSSRIGEPFNVQPNGNSALWFRLRELDRNADYRIYVGSRPVHTTTKAKTGLITAGLTPSQVRRLGSTEGKLPIHLVVPFRGKQLIGHFHVQPR